LRKAAGQAKLPPFHYHDQGSLAVIARYAAVANASGIHFSGVLAWIVWVCMHLMHVVTFQNRLLIFIQGAIQNLTFSRGSRLITGTAPTDFNFNQEVAIPRGVLEIQPETVAGPH
jgi:NADH:ubiquinone reductase (H+-translocating)